MAGLGERDRALVARAAELVAARGDGEAHTVAAAVRSAAGEVVAGLNVYHFTGGPCAELVALGMAVSAGMRELTTIVAVGRRGIMPPCGRCRQVLLDYHPEITVIMPAADGAEPAPIRALLPGAWSWTIEGGTEPYGHSE